MRPKGKTVGSVLSCTVGLLLLLGAAACLPAQLSPEKAIVGKWVNPHGGTIFFYKDQTGFIPGDETATPAIPPTKFTYYFTDKTHLQLAMEGQSSMEVEVRIQGDELTWFNRASDPDYVYKRAK